MLEITEEKEFYLIVNDTYHFNDYNFLPQEKKSLYKLINKHFPYKLSRDDGNGNMTQWLRDNHGKDGFLRTDAPKTYIIDKMATWIWFVDDLYFKSEEMMILTKLATK